MAASDLTDESKSVGWKQTVIVISVVTLLSLTYAIVRYNIVREVPYANLPLFISNKAIALAATILIGLSFLLGPLARVFHHRFAHHLYLRKHLGIAGFGVAAVHAVISLVLLRPAYYPRIFAGSGRLNAQGEVFLLFGILAFLIFTAISVTSLPPIESHMHPAQWKFVQRLGYLAYAFVLLHVGFLGWNGWWRADSWQFGLISISLLAALFIIFVLIMRLIVIAMGPPPKR